MHLVASVCLSVCALLLDIRGSALPSAAKSNKSHYQSIIRGCIRITAQLRSIGINSCSCFQEGTGLGLVRGRPLMIWGVGLEEIGKKISEVLLQEKIAEFPGSWICMKKSIHFRFFLHPPDH